MTIQVHLARAQALARPATQNKVENESLVPLAPFPPSLLSFSLSLSLLVLEMVSPCSCVVSAYMQITA